MISELELEKLVAWCQEGIAIRQRHLPRALATGAGWEIFQYVFRSHLSGARLRIKEIQFGVSVPPTSASRYIEAFEQYGLMERHIDGNDHRASRVSITHYGDLIGREIYSQLCDSFKAKRSELGNEGKPPSAQNSKSSDYIRSNQDGPD